MNYAGIFSGIGGFEYAAKQVGWNVLSWCEWDPFCQRVLKYHFPEAEGNGDITKTDFTKYANKVDVLGGGFPCQPASLAGNRKGIEDDRWLWPQMLRAAKESRTRIIVAENVAGLFSILEPTSLTEVENKEIKLFCENEKYPTSETIRKIQRRVIGTIIEDLKQAGYILPQLEDGTPVVCCIPAAGVNAPHRRDRVWIVAYSRDFSFTNSKRIRTRFNKSGVICNRERDNKVEIFREEKFESRIRSFSKARVSQYTFSKRCQKRNSSKKSGKSGQFSRRCFKNVTYTYRRHVSSISGEYTYNRRKTQEYSISCNPCGNGFITNTTQRNDGRSFREPIKRQKQQPGICTKQDIDCNAQCTGLERRIGTSGSKRFKPGHQGNYWTNFPTESPICTGDDGISERLDNITFSKWRTEAIKAFGNAVVPQIPIELFKVIDNMMKQ